MLDRNKGGTLEYLAEVRRSVASVSIGLTIYRGGLVIISGGDPAVVEAISTQRVRASSIHDKWDNSDRFIGVRLGAPIVRYDIVS